MKDGYVVCEWDEEEEDWVELFDGSEESIQDAIDCIYERLGVRFDDEGNIIPKNNQKGADSTEERKIRTKEEFDALLREIGEEVAKKLGSTPDEVLKVDIDWRIFEDLVP